MPHTAAGTTTPDPLRAAAPATGRRRHGQERERSPRNSSARSGLSASSPVTALQQSHNLGHWPLEKLLTLQVGDLDLSIPKVRMEWFFPSLLERRAGSTRSATVVARQQSLDDSLECCRVVGAEPVKEVAAG